MRMRIEDCLNNYQHFSELTKSPNTVKYQVNQYKMLLRYFKEKKIEFVDEIIESTIDELIIWSRPSCRNITINKRLQHLKMVYKHYKINFPYLLEFRKLKQELLAYDVIYEDELKRLLKYIFALDDSNPYQLTRKLVVLLLLDTGVRQSELLNIEIRNINFHENSIKLTTTKTRRERFVFFTKLTKDLLIKYTSMAPTRKYLLFNYISYKQFTYRNLEVFLLKLRKELGFNKLNSRKFRHTMATVLVENGCTLSSVQQLLGHTSIATTQIYLHMSVKKVKSDFDKYSVLNFISTGE